jgi:hypothetical protein
VARRSGHRRGEGRVTVGSFIPGRRRCWLVGGQPRGSAVGEVELGDGSGRDLGDERDRPLDADAGSVAGWVEFSRSPDPGVSHTAIGLESIQRHRAWSERSEDRSGRRVQRHDRLGVVPDRNRASRSPRRRAHNHRCQAPTSARASSRRGRAADLQDLRALVDSSSRNSARARLSGSVVQAGAGSRAEPTVN